MGGMYLLLVVLIFVFPYQILMSVLALPAAGWEHARIEIMVIPAYVNWGTQVKTAKQVRQTCSLNLYWRFQAPYCLCGDRTDMGLSQFIHEVFAVYMKQGTMTMAA